MTSCSLCFSTNGKAHSFHHVGTCTDLQTHIYYTAPSKCTGPVDTPEAVDYYLLHLQDTKDKKWIWIFDCQNMSSKDLFNTSVTKKFSKIVEEVYFDTLLNVYIVQPTIGIKAIWSFIKPFLEKETCKRIHFCSDGLLDVVLTLEKRGVKRQELTSLTQNLQSPLLIPFPVHSPNSAQPKQKTHSIASHQSHPQ
jgi:hypothetical protein